MCYLSLKGLSLPRSKVLINYNNFLLILLPCVIFTDLKIYDSKYYNAWTDEYFLNNKVVAIVRLIQGCIF